MSENELSHENDTEVLAHLGYKQEFQRAFSPLEVFGIGFSITGLLPSIASTLVFALPNGGPVALVWGWIISACFVFVIALSLAELSSAAPTSGGLYYWTFKYSPVRWRNVLSWIVGYSNTMGNVAGVASIQWGCAVQLMAAVSIGSNLTFTPTTAQIFAVYAGLMILTAIVSSFGTNLVARLQGVYVWLNALLCLAIIIAIPAATPKELKNTASYTFGGFVNLTTWTSGWAFVLSFLMPLWTLGGFDGPIHISEEVPNARRTVPWAIVSAVAISGLLGWVINIVVALYMGQDIPGILASPIGQPMATIFFNSFGTKPTLAVWSIVVAVQFMMATSTLVSCSRQTFAFSRDGGLPFSRFLYKMNTHTKTPVHCVWASAFGALLLGLIAFAGPSAINAIFSSCIVGQYTAFSIPVACRLLGGMPWVPGPFTLGRLSVPIAVTMIFWSAFSIVMLMFPATPNPTVQEMNWNVVVSGGWMLLCVVYYYFPVYGGVHWFAGPVWNVEVETPVEKMSVDVQGKEMGEKSFD